VGAAPSGATGGLTGLIYRSVRGVTRLVGGASMPHWHRWCAGWTTPPAPPRPAREAALAALNGVLGDRLAASGNPLATTMRLRHATTPPVGGRVALLIHGLCMNDLQWRDTETGHDHGDQLAALGYTPVYLVYNTGRPIADNGADLAHQLETWLANWPQPVEELLVLAHSMGGLVARSACHQAQRDGLRWPALLRTLVFLGTPHHGAPLERAGNWVDQVLGSTITDCP